MPAEFFVYLKPWAFIPVTIKDFKGIALAHKKYGQNPDHLHETSGNLLRANRF